MSLCSQVIVREHWINFEIELNSVAGFAYELFYLSFKLVYLLIFFDYLIQIFHYCDSVIFTLLIDVTVVLIDSVNC
jgi:hypothetical protein